MQKKHIIIDCDTGVDDALALLLALRTPTLNVLGITTVAGNALIEKVTRNTLVVVEHAEKDIPVYQGAYRPLVGTWEVAEAAHGSDGLGDIGFADPHLKAETEHAVDFLVHAIMRASVPIELITLAPLTNIALALAKEPRLATRIHKLVMMAGGITGGNVTPAAEFNVWVDPEAADIVFRSAIPHKVMVGLEAIREGGKVHPEEIALLEQNPAPWCQMAGRLLRLQLTRWEKFMGYITPVSPPDLAAMAIALDPTLAECSTRHVTVETMGQHTRGMTIVDQRPYRHILTNVPDPNIEVVTSIDTPRYRELLQEIWLT